MSNPAQSIPENIKQVDLVDEFTKRFKKNPFLTKLVILSFITLFLVCVITEFNSYQNNLHSSEYLLSKDANLVFISEGFDLIRLNYWQHLSEEDLSTRFEKSLEETTKFHPETVIKNKSDLIQAISKFTSKMNKSAKKETAINLLSQVMNNLNPSGRNKLFNQQQEENLNNSVANINPQRDLYKSLGVEKSASSEQITSNYNLKAKELEKQSSPEAKQKLKEISYAYNVLQTPDYRTRYDKIGAEPTVGSIESDTITYIQLLKFSPLSYQDFSNTLNNIKTSAKKKTLIIDIRGNMGGEIDLVPKFEGDFLGNNLFAFNFYHQDNYQPFLTTTDLNPNLSKYKQVFLLIDHGTESSGELLASVFKRNKLAILMGEKTYGWGSIEKVYPMFSLIDDKSHYSLFLVNSLSVRYDGQFIEGNGVEPDIYLSDPDWKRKLEILYPDDELLIVFKKLFSSS